MKWEQHLERMSQRKWFAVGYKVIEGLILLGITLIIVVLLGIMSAGKAHGRTTTGVTGFPPKTITTESHANTLLLTDSISRSRQGFFRRVIDYFGDANKDRNKKFDFSILGGPFYASDLKFGIGLVAAGLYRTNRADSFSQPSNVSLYGSFSTVGFYLLGVKGNHLFPKDRHRLNYTLYFYSFPSYYWGNGYENASMDSNKSRYKQYKVQVKVDFMSRVAPNFYIGPMLTFNYFNALNPECPELWMGESLRTVNYSIGISLVYDSRDFLTNASRGYYLRVDQNFTPAFLGNKYAFSTTELTTSYYHPLWKGGILAGQFHTWLNYGNPLWGTMAYIGSSNSMRGYYEGRYRDKCAMDAQLELRQHIWRRNGIVVWAGAGTVFPDFASFRARHILPNYGFGYRWEFKKKVNVRLDMGFGKGQNGFIFNINEAF